MGIARALALVAVVGGVAAPASALTEDEERAKAHFLAGQSYYEQASYADALKEFNEAYRISKRPPLLYNIARCYESMEQLDKAIEALQMYLQVSPNADDRIAIESRIKNLQDRQAAKKEAPPPPTTPQPVTPPPTPAAVSPTPTVTAAPARPRHHLYTWVLGGVGIGALGAALGTGITSQLDYNDLNGKCMSNVCNPSLRNEASTGKSLSLATDILWPVGAALVVTSVALFIIESKKGRVHAALLPTGMVAHAF
jgi:tetratricopeptide (TPR) repeat protein